MKGSNPSILLILCFPFLILGCSEDRSITDEFKETRWHGHVVIAPEPEIHYKFKNLAKGYSKATWNDQIPANQRKQWISPSVWSSTCSGKLKLHWKGFKTSKELKFPLANFDYLISDFSFDETSADGKHVWKESYNNGDEKIRFEVDGRKVEKPMGQMLGDPRDQYVNEPNQLLLYPNGNPVRLPGELYKCNDGNCAQYAVKAYGIPAGICSYCKASNTLHRQREQGALLARAKYRTDSFSIGQYFLKGIRYEELAHRIGFLTIPESIWKQKSQRASWSTSFPVWVVPKGKTHTPIKIKYDLLGKTQVDGQSYLKINAQVQQRLKEAILVSTGQVIQGWEYTRKGLALIDQTTHMVHKIEWIDQAHWYDVLPYIRKGQKPKHQVVSRSFHNQFTAERIKP